MRKRSPKFFPARLSQYVANMPYVGGSEGHGVVAVNLGTPNAAAAAAIINTTSIASVGSVVAAGMVVGPTPDGQTEAIMGRFGRRLSVVASGAATSTVSVTGRDYLGQKIVNTVTLNGTTAVESLKAFRWVDMATWGTTAATTITIGTGAGLGLPYKALALKDELRDNVLVTSGALVVGAAATVTQNATSADPRGIYTPNAAPDGTANLAIRTLIDTTDGYGKAHYGG